MQFRLKTSKGKVSGWRVCSSRIEYQSKIIYSSKNRSCWRHLSLNWLVARIKILGLFLPLALLPTTGSPLTPTFPPTLTPVFNVCSPGCALSFKNQREPFSAPFQYLRLPPKVGKCWEDTALTYFKWGSYLFDQDFESWVLMFAPSTGN